MSTEVSKFSNTGLAARAVVLSLMLLNQACSPSRDNYKYDPFTPSTPSSGGSSSIPPYKASSDPYTKSPLGVASLAKIKVSSVINSTKQEYFSRDLEFLRTLHIDSTLAPAVELQRVMGITNTSPQEMTNWLNARFKYLADGSYRDSYRTAELVGLDEVTTSEGALSETGATSEMVTNAYNPSSGFYQDKLDGIASGKYTSSTRLYATIPGIGDVLVDSPRVGIVVLGDGLFRDNGTGDLADVANTMARIKTYFHEARHSDGNSRSKTMGLLHEKCPSWHDYSGNYACDNQGNGPYTLGSKLLSSFASSCTTCSTKSKTAIGIIAKDNIGRVLDTTFADDTQE